MNDAQMDRQFLGEWIQSYYRIPNAEYEKLARTFNPIYFNADEWVQIARDAGMKYLVFTSKHHDGFAMYRSRVSKFNVVEVTVDDRTPNTRWNPGAGILRSVSLKRAAALRWNPRTCSSGSFRRIHLRHLQGGLPLGGGTQWSRTAA